MQQAKHHKAYVGVLGVALAAWAGDAILFQDGTIGPTQAQAAAEAAVPATRADAPAAKPENVSLPGTSRLAARLQSLKDGAASAAPSPLFANAADWLSPPAEDAPEPSIAAVATPVAPASEPKVMPAHQLTSVLAAGERSCVILDGKTLRLGETLSGLRLHAVEFGAAVFERDGELVRLTVQVR